MSNPDNAIGTNGAYSGRTSVNAFNDCISSYSRGILSGWSCVVSSGLTVSLGGVNGTRDVAIATDNNGNNTTINNISESPVNVTISSAPATDSRVDSIVAYVDNPPTGVSTTADNPGACGLIVVKGTVASSPIAPDDGTIRTAITADGASGTTAYYVVLADITIATGMTDLNTSNITQGSLAQMNGSLLASDSTPADKVDWNTTKSKTPFIVEFNRTSDLTTNITSDRGNVYNITIVNNGSGIKINSGATNINKVITTVGYTLSQNITNNSIGVHGTFINNTNQLCKFISGLKNASPITPVQKNVSSGTTYVQFNYDNTSLSFGGAVCRTEWVRVPGQNRWNGFFEMNFVGNNTTYYGITAIYTADMTSVPSIYQPSTSGYINYGYQSLEIYE